MDLWDTVTHLQNTRAEYSYERFGNGTRIIYVYPTLGLDATGDLVSIGPVQEIHFDFEGRRK